MAAGRLFSFLAGCTCLAGAAQADLIVIRPGECAAGATTYLLAPNSQALIKIEEQENIQYIVFRPQALQGWASQRVLRRFDLEIEEEGLRVFNTGGYCSEAPR